MESPRIGVLGGMGPSATVDFMDKLVRLTPAQRDQEHIPVVVASFPHIPDRSRAILGTGTDPLPHLLAGIDFLNAAGVGVIAIPCNSSHHWFAQMSERSAVPMLHIARCCVASLDAGRTPKAAVFATRGALASGFYQRELQARGVQPIVPDDALQAVVDESIRQVKAGDIDGSHGTLSAALSAARDQGAGCVIMGCTEIPIAARSARAHGLLLIDSSLELARAAVAHAIERGWNKAAWEC